MKKSLFVVLYLMVFTIGLVNAQNISPKAGGICFRVDDYQSPTKWRDWNAVFNKYGYKFSLAINVSSLFYDTAAINALKEIVNSGHELMDHTPDHHMGFFTVKRVSDANKFSQNPAVHHITGNKICLKLGMPITNSYNGEGLVNLVGNKLISVSNGEFKTLNGNPYTPLLYLPTKNMILLYNSLDNKIDTDPDTLTIQTYWQENFITDNANGIPYERLTTEDLRTLPISNILLANRSIEMFKEYGLPIPKTWIQPGGNDALLTKSDVKSFAQIVGYTAGAVNVQSSLKTFNEVDSFGDKRFGIQGPDFYEENDNFNELINIFANRSARNFQSVGLSHMNNVAGGWPVFLLKVDSILSWCKANNITIRTYNQLASVLFDSVPNSLVNTFPSLDKDIDYNGLPDGFTVTKSTFDSTDGVAMSNYKSLYASANNTNFASIFNLGGLEKGQNRFSIYSKGQTGDSIRIIFNFPEITDFPNQFLMVAANTPDWTKQIKNISIPYNVSRANFSFILLKGNQSGVAKMSGIELKSMIPKVANKRIFKKNVAKNFDAIPFDNLVYENFDKYENLLLNFNYGKSLKIDTSNLKLYCTTNHKFFEGIDSIKITSQNSANLSDSGYIYLQSSHYLIKEGETLTENINFNNLIGNVQVSSNPYDTFLNYSNNTFVAKPQKSTWYTFNWQDNNGNNTDSFLVAIINTNKDSGSTLVPSIFLVKNTLINIFPNPTTDWLQVVTNGNIEMESISCYNVIGKQENCHLTIESYSAKMDCNNLTKGVYYLKIKLKNGTVKNTTFVKN
jgi:hypothetical protein